MTRTLGRRDFLAGSAAVAGAAVGGGFTCVEFASAAPIEVPVVDKLSIKVLVDSTHNLFLRTATVNGVSVQPTPLTAGFPNVIHTQWGLSLWLESQRGSDYLQIREFYIFALLDVADGGLIGDARLFCQ